MRTIANRETILSERVRKKTAALLRIQKICKELLVEDQLRTPQYMTVQLMHHIASEGAEK